LHALHSYAVPYRAKEFPVGVTERLLEERLSTFICEPDRFQAMLKAVVCRFDE
jgi:hypothetical protein